MENPKMWIGGKRVGADSGKTYGVFNPSTEEEIAQVPLGGEAEVNMAVDAAKKAFPVWAGKTQTERSEIVMKIARALKDHTEELAELDILEHGTPKMAATMAVKFSAERIEYTAQVARGLMGHVQPIKSDVLFYLQREPIGVCALIIPWNVPLRMIGAKLGTALSVGNTCIIKPPSINSLVALKVGEILDELDVLPPGAVNIVTGPGSSVGGALASHPDVGMVSFTGSSETGKSIMSSASGTVKRLLLELGGKNPFIVLEDADLEAAVSKAVFTTHANTGQICAAPGRFFICDSLYDAFVEKYVENAQKIVVGDPNDEKTVMGPVVSAEHRDKVEALIRSGIEEGADLLLGGERPQTPPLNKGYFVVPTAFGNVTQEMTLAQEEVFGPVACISKFSSENEVLRLANENRFGLSASVWTKDMTKAQSFINKLEAGYIWVNDHMTITSEQPWGGFKESGFGKENSALSLQEYTRLKAVSMQF